MKSAESAGLAGYIVVSLVVVASLAGCRWKEPVIEKKPRPVEVAVLSRGGGADTRRLVKGSVNSWRTETVAMEVGGRLLYLAEENAVFEPDRDRNDEAYQQLPSLEPKSRMGPRVSQLLARLDDEKYRILVEKAAITRQKTEASIKAAREELDSLLPAQKRAAEAEFKLAERDYERAAKLFAQNAESEAELFRNEAKMENARAAVQQADAAIAAQRANIESLEKQLLEDQKNLEDAERNLRECELRFTSFRGELTRTEVEQGDLIQPNQVIGTVQMMDPIMIEFEASSYDSRRLAKMQKLNVYVDGQQQPLPAKLYEIDSVADPSSRTFTVTLLMVNKRADVPQNAGTTLMTDGLLPLDISFLGEVNEGVLHAAEGSIFQDDQGYFVLRAENVKRGETLAPDQLLEVTPVRVEVAPERKLFYGEVYFREIQPLSEATDRPALDPDRDLITGPIQLPTDVSTDNWDWDKNNRIELRNNRQWLLRPGELVDVDISSEPDASDAFRVPIDAISVEESRYYLFLLSEQDSTVEKVEVVRAGEATSDRQKETSSYLSIRPASEETSLEGRRFVLRGAHYLIDGEPVRVVTSEE